MANSNNNQVVDLGEKKKSSFFKDVKKEMKVVVRHSLPVNADYATIQTVKKGVDLVNKGVNTTTKNVASKVTPKRLQRTLSDMGELHNEDFCHTIKVVVFGARNRSGKDPLFQALGADKYPQFDENDLFPNFITQPQHVNGIKSKIEVWDASALIENVEDGDGLDDSDGAEYIERRIQLHSGREKILVDVDVFLLCFNILSESTLHVFSEELLHDLISRSPLAQRFLVSVLYTAPVPKNASHGPTPEHVSKQQARHESRRLGCIRYMETIPDIQLGIREIVEELLPLVIRPTLDDHYFHQKFVCGLYDKVLRAKNELFNKTDSEFTQEYDIDQIHCMVIELDQINVALATLQEQANRLFERRMIDLQLLQQENGIVNPMISQQISSEQKEAENLLKQLIVKGSTFRFLLEDKMSLYM